MDGARSMPAHRFEFFFFFQTGENLFKQVIHQKCIPIAASGEQLAAAVCSRLSVPGGASLDTEMALVWHMPKVHFQSPHTR